MTRLLVVVSLSLEKSALPSNIVWPVLVGSSLALPLGGAHGGLALGEAELREIEPLMSRVIPEAWNDRHFQHTYEGPDDMPAHAKTTLFTPEVLLPVAAPESEDGIRRRADSVEAEGAESALASTVPEERVDTERRTTDEKSKRFEKCYQRLDFGPSQTVALNEHRDGGGWGGGHARKLVFSALGVPAESRDLVCGEDGKIFTMRHVVPVTMRSRPGATAPMKAHLERAFRKALAKVQIGGLHCYVRAHGAGLVVARRTDAAGGEMDTRRGMQDEAEVGTDSRGEDGGEAVRQVLESVIPDRLRHAFAVPYRGHHVEALAAVNSDGKF
ncbi:conserved hypothetical protein [Neospora caninum Liverpool]|uniref:Uncharacterized protein n=1 Tax=Neospora caninum (strain Liverpool) TaxID=572307 RepID=F0VJY7_NEOCL|nr:conserved hypothetical protein [Neospora caninum Liverpool]CBZ54049.1 conserved hypothetical protein [Neospora caninum Liverpool]|eukprot:XP_003884080.1 conserved hypothetical protein [Neospora caninum Liverpool]